MSTGLVIFHFGTKTGWSSRCSTRCSPRRRSRSELISPTSQSARSTRPLLRQEMARLSTEPKRNRLFFEFWNEGMWNAPSAFACSASSIATRSLPPHGRSRHRRGPDRFAGVTPADLAAVAVSFIKGCAVQSMVEPHSTSLASSRRRNLLAAPSLAAIVMPSLRKRTTDSPLHLPRAPRCVSPAASFKLRCPHCGNGAVMKWSGAVHRRCRPAISDSSAATRTISPARCSSGC